MGAFTGDENTEICGAQVGVLSFTTRGAHIRMHVCLGGCQSEYTKTTDYFNLDVRTQPATAPSIKKGTKVGVIDFGTLPLLHCTCNAGNVKHVVPF